MKYPALIEPDGDGFMVSFRDIPEALTGAPTYEEALTAAALVLIDAADFYAEDGIALPAPSSATEEEVLIEFPLKLDS